MQEALNNLKKIQKWIDNSPSPSTFKTNNDFMKFLVEEVMSRAVYLLKIGVSLAPDTLTAKKGYTKHHAIIIGHMVRLFKLYQGFCIHVADCQEELASVFIRLIYETEIRLNYFLKCKNKNKALKSYVLTSYRSEKESLLDLETKQKQRSLLPIEKRIKRSMMRHLRKDSITFKELKITKSWKIDGHDLRAMLKALDREWEYSYSFGGSSRWVHGSWLELKTNHLRRDGRYYTPFLEFGTPDPRHAAPITINVLDTMLSFLNWNKSDPNRILTEVLENLINLVRQIDTEHEKRLVLKGVA